MTRRFRIIIDVEVDDRDKPLKDLNDWTANAIASWKYSRYYIPVSYDIHEVKDK